MNMLACVYVLSMIIWLFFKISTTDLAVEGGMPAGGAERLPRRLRVMASDGNNVMGLARRRSVSCERFVFAIFYLYKTGNWSSPILKNMSW